MAKRGDPTKRHQPKESQPIDRSWMPPEKISWGELKKRYRKTGPRRPEDEDYGA